jgi:hypothetical protein
VGPAFPPLASGEGPLSYEEMVGRLDEGMAWLAKLYANTMNVIHFMHDKYDYERIQVRGWCVVGRARGGGRWWFAACRRLCPAPPPRTHPSAESRTRTTATTIHTTAAAAAAAT